MDMKTQLIKEVQALYKKLGRTPKMAEFDEEYEHVNAMYYHYKSWNKLLAAADIPIVRGISKEETTKRILSLAKELDRTPTEDEFRAKFGMKGVGVHFGTYNDMLRAVGLPVNTGYTVEEMEDMLVKQIDKLGRIPTEQEFRLAHTRQPNIYSKFKNWDDFLKHCGFERETINQYKDMGDYYKVSVYDNIRKKKDYILIDKKHKKKLEGRYINWNKESSASVSDSPNPPLHLTTFLFGELEDGFYYLFTNKDNRDYRSSNIEVVSRQEQMRRNALKKDNKTGVKGVCWVTRSQRYIAYIGLNGKNIYLGSFKDLADAKQARLEGEEKYWGKVYSE